ncbi:hypothetical protein [Aquimarina sp. RZ0]|uniref:hypothetical protein n=1 Tax=Aquimarina sp. RZ0 TaxID=2607730 RepID=UPI0011F21D66|nr:hypothetical protein [Aquimarina sp. RZ0]KAA1246091.1 hypothetical protein F0000_08895 [Aquimarina sp. RZ0]
MKKVIFSVAILFCVATVTAQSNTSTITQKSFTSSIDVTQIGSENNADIVQSGMYDNQAVVVQGGDVNTSINGNITQNQFGSYSEVFAQQEQEENTISQKQTGAFAVGFATQNLHSSGGNNVAIQVQHSDIESGGALAESVQNGSDNISRIFQFSTRRSTATIEQTGERNLSEQLQRAANLANTSRGVQFGSDNVLMQTQNDIYSSLYAIQGNSLIGSNGNMIVQEQTGTSHSASAEQQGDGTSSVHGNLTMQKQQGDSNRAVSYQTGVANVIDIFQDGFDNIAEVTQTATNNSITIHQTGYFHSTVISQGNEYNIGGSTITVYQSGSL